jgi:ribosomal protein S18 acetylase RimI-like enzyme
MGNLNPFRSRLQRGGQLSNEKPELATLTRSDVRDVRLPWLSRFSTETLASHLEANPGKALWVPATGEYLVAERWRHRDDICQIVEVTARRGRAALVSALTERVVDEGYKLALLSEEVWNDQPHSYAEMGFGHLERIVFFQRSLKGLSSLETTAALPDLEYQIAEKDDLDLLVHLDNNSFPWLWWNSHEEMDIYVRMGGVSAYIARIRVPGGGEEPVGYASFTMYDGWAHLDRLAVVTALQGRRFGASQLVHAMERMIGHGAGHVALSTQENNYKSHGLYKGFGFKQTRDYVNLYGKRLAVDG